MRAVIFQIGLLLFFVSIVTLWLQGMDIVVALAKSFILFVMSTLMMFLIAYLFVFLRRDGVGRDEISNSNGLKS